ncbi:MAG: hypothetical protein ABIW76_11715 [Fibrobacteria bacterium]
MDSLETTGITRRTFLGTAAAALFAGVVIQITGCSTEDKEGSPAGNITGSISDTHSHSAVVTKAVLDSGGAAVIDIRGSATHTHTVSLSGDDMAALKAGHHVMMTSSIRSESTADDQHSHSVMFN